VTQTVDQLVPVAVPGLGSSAQALRLGATVSCAELGQGSVRCWGTPLQGMKTGPIDPGLSNVASLSVGVGHACATSGTRAAWCWGSNTSGELGTGTLTSTPTPQLVGGAQLPWVSVGSGSSHTCGLVADGTVRCWGSPSYGLLGNGTGGTQLQPLPAPVVGLSGVASLQVGYWGNYATVGNQVLVWGNTNLADSPAQPTRASMTPLRGRPPQRIRLGGLSNVCALLESEAWCMGFNQYGEVGNGITPADEFVGLSHVVDLPSGLLDLSVGDYHACALGSAGEVWCWGDNDQGQLGTPAPAVSSRPLRVAGLPVGVEQVVLGGDSSCALTSSGEAWCWGNGLLGSASSPSVPARVQLGGAVAQLALGAYNGCARLRSGVLKCWGSYTPSWALETVTFPSTAAVVAVDASPSTVCAVLSDGSVWCWGYNSSGEVGDGTTTHTSTPHSVLGLSQARSVSVGADQACAIKQDGTVWCWGQENRVGRGSSATSTVLAGPVPGLSNVETIDAALFTTYAVTHDGAVMCIASSVERCAL
jgi:alpha-tubulin suppressor-like RCC1 family protein